MLTEAAREETGIYGQKWIVIKPSGKLRQWVCYINEPYNCSVYGSGAATLSLETGKAAFFFASRGLLLKMRQLRKLMFSSVFVVIAAVNDRCIPQTGLPVVSQDDQVSVLNIPLSALGGLAIRIFYSPRLTYQKRRLTFGNKSLWTFSSFLILTYNQLQQHLLSVSTALSSCCRLHHRHHVT